MKVLRTYWMWTVCHRHDPEKNFDRIKEKIMLNHFFKTRRECKTYIDEEYGYFKTRKDLREYPHGWLMPVPRRVLFTIQGEQA